MHAEASSNFLGLAMLRNVMSLLAVHMHVMSCSGIVLTDCRCRCVIPDKQKLEANLTNLMNTKFPDGAGTGIVTDATWEAHERALKIVREGRVSGRS
jgi:hypothetical protein